MLINADILNFLLPRWLCICNDCVNKNWESGIDVNKCNIEYYRFYGDERLAIEN